MQVIVHILLTTALLFVVGRTVKGIEVRDGEAAFFGAIMLGLANAFIRPLLLTLAMPITMVTLGLFVWVINAAMLMLAAEFVDGFEVRGFGAALWGSIWLAVLNFAVGILLPI